MFYPFEVSDPSTELRYRLSDTRLAELSLASVPCEWNVGGAILETPSPIWSKSLSLAPSEVISVVSGSLRDVILSTPGLRPVSIDDMPPGRARRHLEALLELWHGMGEALPEGLSTARYVLELPFGQFLGALPVVEGSLDRQSPAAMRALFDRLRSEFGSVPAPAVTMRAREGSCLHSLQVGVAAPAITRGKKDETLAFYGLRDPASCADFAAAQVREIIAAGCPAREIAVMTSGSVRHLARAFKAQGIPLSGLASKPVERDAVGETLLFLLLSKRPSTPAMALASLCLSPLMPWSAEIGGDLAEEVMRGNFRPRLLSTLPEFTELWNDIRASANSRQQLKFLLDRICERLSDGVSLRPRLISLQALLAGEGNPDWEAILRAVHINSPEVPTSDRNLEGVSIWSANETPWRPCRHLIIADFTEGHYPFPPPTNPLFLDSEIAQIASATGLQLRGRSEGLTRSLALLDAQLQAVSGSVTFLIPWRNLAGERLAPSAGLSLVARAIERVDNSTDLIVNLTSQTLRNWPVASHMPQPLPKAPPFSNEVHFDERDLLALRLDDAGTALPQSPSRLETLIVSPLAWLLGELNVGDMAWSAETLDVKTKGNIAHFIFEHVFLPGTALPVDDELDSAVTVAFDNALGRYAGFLHSPAWEMERTNLLREIQQIAVRWKGHLVALDAKIIANELRLAGVAHGIHLGGRADCILQLPSGAIAIVDHKKSASKARRRRMEAGWDLQAGLYRDMIARPLRRENDGLEPLLGQAIGIAYHLMNDGGLLTSGLNLAVGGPAREMGMEIGVEAVTRLTERIAEVRRGCIKLNTTKDAAFFDKQAGFTPYALDASPLISAFMWSDEA